MSTEIDLEREEPETGIRKFRFSLSARISTILAILSLVVSTSIAYGAYKTKFEDQNIMLQKQQLALENLTQSMNRLEIQVALLEGRLASMQHDGLLK